MESERDVSNGLIAPKIDANMNSPSAKAAIGSGFFAFEDSVEAERDPLQEKLNR